jgi:predicted small secreted protein
MRLFFGAVAIAVVLLLFVFVMASPAEARQMRNDECSGVAQDVATIAQVRDSGAKEENVVKQAQLVFKQNLGLKDSYIQTQDDIAYMTTLIHIIFQRTNLTPQRLGQMVYNSCTKYGFGHLYEISKANMVVT